jgi:hypothetical protein
MAVWATVIGCLKLRQRLIGSPGRIIRS